MDRGHANIVGEIMYSQSLDDGHRYAQLYLTPESDICGVILIDLQNSRPRDNDGRFTLEGPMVYYYYERQRNGNDFISPTEVVSFGTIWCRWGGPPCDVVNLGFIVNVPGRVLLNTNPEDEAIAIRGQVYQSAEVPQEYDMQIYLNKLEQKILL
jgi:hypothetical protein